MRKDNGHIEWSTYFGGHGSAVRNLDIDKYGRLLVTGHNLGDLPEHTVPLPTNAEQWPFTPFMQFGYMQADAFVAIIQPDYQILWSTYIGGEGNDIGYSVRFGDNKIVVAGYAGSPSIPTLDAGNGGHFVNTLTGSHDAFIMEFDMNGNQLWGTYTGYRIAMGEQGLAVDQANGDVFLVGTIQSGILPVTTTAPWYDDTYVGNDDGVIMQFSGSDQSIRYATYVSEYGLDEPRAVVVLPDGQFIVGGLTWDHQLQTKSLAGLYTEPSLMGVGDAFIMAFTADHWLSWFTYFGGAEDHPNAHADCIRTLALKGSSKLYAAGYTDAAYDQGEFFPLHDAGGGAWPDQTRDPETDGFVSAFCIQNILTGVGDRPAEHNALAIAQKADGQLQVWGLDARKHRYSVTDAVGRRVTEGTIQGGGQAFIPVGKLSEGAYVVQIDGYAAQRVLLINPAR
ncbi:MAG: hypothetical protein KBF80_13175 [Flavobacteriales bacterium]|nr:hypothetical protein [Flavobacteriales bacterium]